MKPITIKDVEETYSVLISHLEKLPGGSIEDAFKSTSPEELRRELEFVRQLSEPQEDEGMLVFEDEDDPGMGDIQ